MNALPTAETYEELQQAFDHFNQALFAGTLPACLITLQRKGRTFGYFSADRFARRSGEHTDEIAMNPAYFAVRSIKQSLSTLAHEMVHLWQHHFGEPGRRRHHNKEWAEKMEEVGLMPSDTGLAGGKRTGDHVTHYVIEGGAFEVACDHLLTQDFVLSWVDRFPASDGFARLGGDPGGAGLDLRALGIEPPAEPVNRSNRVKYRCPTCGAQVWGKPGLNILCGECEGAEFEARG